MNRTLAFAGLALGLSLVGAAAQAAGPGPYASGPELQAALAAGATSSAALVDASRRRVARLDRGGPRLNSVIALEPGALAQARRRDAARRRGEVLGPLDGLPILVKDNIETSGPLATTAGSLALAGNVTGRDAVVVARLKAAGAVILGKTNLSEWANFRSTRSISGWSAVGGLTRNPFALDRTPCGSSSGSAAAVAAGFAVAAIGTETDGSITCPAAANGLVGFKPTLGLVPRTFIVPLSPAQDTAGPIARTVEDAAAVLAAIAGADPRDPATAEADAHRPDLLVGLRPGALAGVRLGVLRGVADVSPGVGAAFDRTLQALRGAGAVLVDLSPPSRAELDAISEAETVALQTEFKAAVADYLASTPGRPAARSLAELIAFNAATPAETALFGQETFLAAAARPSLSDASYRAARETARRLARDRLDSMLAAAGAAALVVPTGAPASVNDPINGARFLGSFSTLPAVAGYPHLTVPMGQVNGLPVGLSIIGPAWSDARVLAIGYGVQQAGPAWRAPRFPASAPLGPEQLRVIDPP